MHYLPWPGKGLLIRQIEYEHNPKLRNQSFFFAQNTTKNTILAVYGVQPKTQTQSMRSQRRLQQPPPLRSMVDTYKAVLVRFMSYLNKQEYHKDYKFSQEELGAVKPMDVKHGICAFEPTAQQSLTGMTTLCMQGRPRSCFGRRQSPTSCQIN
jgi:hypothetical protein